MAGDFTRLPRCGQMHRLRCSTHGSPGCARKFTLDDFFLSAFSRKGSTQVLRTSPSLGTLLQKHGQNRERCTCFFLPLVFFEEKNSTTVLNNKFI